MTTHSSTQRVLAAYLAAAIAALILHAGLAALAVCFLLGAGVIAACAPIRAWLEYRLEIAAFENEFNAARVAARRSARRSAVYQVL